MPETLKNPPRTYRTLGDTRHCGVDLAAFHRCAWSAARRAAVREGLSPRRALPELRLRRRQVNYGSGTGWPGSHRAAATFGRDQPVGEVLVLILHELTHVAVGKVGGKWHGPSFRTVQSAAAAELWGIEVEDPRLGAVYDLDRKLERALALADDGDTPIREDGIRGP